MKIFLVILFYAMTTNQICFAIEKSTIIPDGISFYEFVLLLLGVLLFLVLLLFLIRDKMRDHPIATLLPWFLIPIIMIGYPAIQKITFDNNTITIEKAQSILSKTPNDIKAKQDMKEALSNIQDKNISNPQTLITVSKGYATLGDTVNALTYVEKAIQEDPKLNEANKLYAKFNKPEVRIERITKEVNANPKDLTLQTDLKNEVSTATRHQESDFASIQVFPNPASNYITILFDGINAIGSYSIYDVSGRLVLKTNKQSRATQIFTGTLLSGVYLVELRVGQNRYRQKLIIQ